MRIPAIHTLLAAYLVLVLAVGAMPSSSGGGERHAGTVLGVDSGTRTLVLEEFGANAERRVLRVRVSDQGRVLLSERNSTVTDFNDVFRDTPIGLADLRAGDFVVVELAQKPNVADLVMVTARGGASSQ